MNQPHKGFDGICQSAVVLNNSHIGPRDREGLGASEACFNARPRFAASGLQAAPDFIERGHNGYYQKARVALSRLFDDRPRYVDDNRPPSKEIGIDTHWNAI